MTILQGNIRLVASQIMSDAPESGGAPTNTGIVDGQSNGVFPDISETDRAGGRVNLRKVFVQIDSNNSETYMGANVVLEDAPDDPNVSVTLFSTRETFDRRSAAVDRIESYLAAGTALSLRLFGDHIAGQMTVALFGQSNVELPTIGTTLVLRKFPGQAGQADQYVRITDVSSRLRTFTDGQGDFNRMEVSVGISDPLEMDFPGFEVIRDDTAYSFTGRTRVHDTVVADASRYYGVTPLTDAASIGDFTVNTEGIFSQIVPSAQVETPIADARMTQQSVLPVEAGGVLTQNLTLNFTTSQAMYVGGGITPSSLTIARAGITLRDKGGTLINDATSQQVGTVNYADGIVSLLTNVFGTSGNTHVVSYTPAVSPTLVTNSFSVPVTQGSQRLTYVFTLNPGATRGSTQVTYRAQGRWYTLTDDGSGALRGADSSFGVGTINYSTGTVSLTVGALPDVGSKLLVAWAPAPAAAKLSSIPVVVETLEGKAFFAFNLGKAIKPGTLVLNWSDSVGPRTATDNSLGSFNGYAIGEVNYATGIVRFAPATLPPIGTTLNIAITQAAQQAASVSNFVDGGASWTFSMGGVVKPYSLEFAVATQRPVREFPGVDKATYAFLRVFDDGAGNLKMAVPTGNINVGSINYASGAASLLKSVASYVEVQGRWENTRPWDAGGSADDQAYINFVGNETRTITLSIINGPGSVTIAAPAWAWWTTFTGVAQARWGGADSTLFSTTLALSTLYARKSNGRMFLGTDSFDFDQNTGRIIRNRSVTTGIGSNAGVRSSGYNPLVSAMYGWWVWELSAWPDYVSSTIGNSSGVVEPALGAGTTLLVDSAAFRTAVAPLRAGSVSVVGTWDDGSVFVATCDINGNISTGSAAVGPDGEGSQGVFGKVNFQTGVVEVRFGKRVGSSFASAVGVTDLTYLNIPGVTLVRSTGARADSLRYNASAYTYIPLDSSIIGVNPVRLPSDGRVPIFRSGSYAVVGHTASVTATVANGQVINCGRVRLSRVRVIGANGVVINTGHTVDLEAGLVTFTDVTGYSQPVKVEHRIEDMALVSDAQISGDITFTRPLTHDYPVGSSVSSALVAGDLYARVSTLFDQATWTGAWADTLTGGSAGATFNDIANPIAVTNAGALTERWVVQFTNSTSFTVTGEHVGMIANGTINSDCSPLNPATSQPYFSIPAAGWGNGWAVGNYLRFNTEGAEFPVWVVRTVQQGPETPGADQFTLLVRGDVDRP